MTLLTSIKKRVTFILTQRGKDGCNGDRVGHSLCRDDSIIQESCLGVNIFLLRDSHQFCCV